MKGKNGKWPFVEVEWVDTTAVAEWTAVKDELPCITTVVCRGWLVFKDKKAVTLCASYIVPEKGEVTEIVSDSCVIPRGCVVKIRVLKV